MRFATGLMGASLKPNGAPQYSCERRLGAAVGNMCFPKNIHGRQLCLADA